MSKVDEAGFESFICDWLVDSGGYTAAKVGTAQGAPTDFDPVRALDTTELFAGVDRGNSIAFARTAAEAGSSLVVGHGPHVMRGAEWWDGALVAYSLGNLLTYGPFNLTPPNDRGALLCATLDAGGAVLDAEMRSTRQRAMGHVGADARARAALVADSLSRLDFPWTAARIAGDGTIRRPAPHHP